MNENLEKGKATRFTSGERAVEAGRKGGKKSQEVYKKKKAMKEMAKMILDMQVPTKELKKKLEAMGIDSEDTTYQAAIMIGILQQAMKGNVKAAAFIRDTAGENPMLEANQDEGEENLADVIENAYRNRIGVEDDVE